MKKYSRSNKKKSIYGSKPSKLPSNYLELYFDTIKQNWRTIVSIGLLSLLFFAPAIAFLFWDDVYFMQLIASELPIEEIDALRITGTNIFNIFVCLGVVLSSIGISGLSRINLMVSREEGFIFFQDFNKGVKQNIKNNFVMFLIYGVLVYFSLLVMTNMNTENILVYFPFAMVQSIFFPVLLISVNTNSIYSWSIKDTLRNGFIIYIRNFLVIFLFSAVYSSVLLLNAISYVFLRYILLAIIIVVIYPFISLALRVYLNKVLDRDINKEHYPQIYKKGIHENLDDDYLKEVICKFYGPTSTFKSLKNDPYLNEYYYHLTSYLSENINLKEKTLMAHDGIWPDEPIIDSLNYIRGLVYQKQITFLRKKHYSVLGLRQKEKAKVAIVLAGGGYAEVCTLPEDTPVSVELHKLGFNVFSFVYPVKEEAKLANEELKKFINFLFKNQERMNIDMEDYIIVGFSAAGHLAASVASDNLGITNNPKPLLLGLCYPVITMLEDTHIGTRDNLLGVNPSQEEKEKYSIELHVGDDFSNCFIWQCDKDEVVPFNNSLLLVDSLKKKDIDYRFESFDDDKHGYGIAKNKVADGWFNRMYDYYLLLLNNKKL